MGLTNTRMEKMTPSFSTFQNVFTREDGLVTLIIELGRKEEELKRVMHGWQQWLVNHSTIEHPAATRLFLSDGMARYSRLRYLIIIIWKYPCH